MIQLLGVMPLWIMPMAAEAVDLAEELEEAEEAGFGFSSDILGSNLINIAIILGLLIYLGRNVIGEALAKRKAAIVAELEQAEQKKQTALEALADQQQKLAQAQQEAERIKQQAEANAEKLRAELIAQAERDIERMRANAEKDASTERERVIQELRRQIALRALAQVEAELPQRVSESIQGSLIEQGIQQLGGQR
ncbi:MAG: F0F1 ATP synthase subunit B [Cyanobacteriota bacterium]|nr:F0F1 ATP synthase subunit B [Cyanobacteriota bacterium]